MHRNLLFYKLFFTVTVFFRLIFLVFYTIRKRPIDIAMHTQSAVVLELNFYANKTRVARERKKIQLISIIDGIKRIILCFIYRKWVRERQWENEKRTRCENILANTCVCTRFNASIILFQALINLHDFIFALVLPIYWNLINSFTCKSSQKYIFLFPS